MDAKKAQLLKYCEILETAENHNEIFNAATEVKKLLKDMAKGKRLVRRLNTTANELIEFCGEPDKSASAEEVALARRLSKLIKEI